LTALPARVEVAGSIAQARAWRQASAHALWLVDAHLPDGDGLDCLRALGVHGAAPALAITAGRRARGTRCAVRGRLPGSAVKPVSIAMLHATVRRLLGGTAA
jgi:DNA-binding NtrC family response regulator